MDGRSNSARGGVQAQAELVELGDARSPFVYAPERPDTRFMFPQTRRNVGRWALRKELERIREWANEKAQSGQEPPWAWFQYMKLVETADAILAGMDATITQPDLQGSPPRSETHLRLVGGTRQPDSVRRRRAAPPVQLPM